MHIHADSAVIADQLLQNICIEVNGPLISAISHQCSQTPAYKAIGTVIPGFVDIHSHGGGGHYFSDPNLENVKKARELHRLHGTTSLVASLVTEPIGILEEQIRRISPLVDSGLFAGIHLEGPYLSEARCGAHKPSLLRDPKIEELGALIDGASDNIVMFTLAPEREGGIAAIEYLVSRNIRVALGHSQATDLETRSALDAGASLITHFSNGMPKPYESVGTIASAALESSHLPLEIILDGIHISNETLETVKCAGEKRIILVTDAMSAAGAGDGRFTIGDLNVTVSDGVARLDSNGALAGSTLTMDIAFKNYLRSGASIIEAVHAASTLPAEVLGLRNVGSIAIGKRADLLEFNGDLPPRLIQIS